ncbi:MAG: NAD(P)/FAD-dependent oxidoreductase [Thermoflexales bacterium]
MTTADVVIIGGGFYGCVIAIYLAQKGAFGRIVLFERDAQLLSRASYNNQARIHAGYHYPRSFTTAFRSRANFPRFARDWPDAVQSDFIKLYAIARHHSKVTAKQFERFCAEIGAKLQPAEAALKRLFNPHLVEEVFLTEEYAFDPTKLAEWARQALRQADVQVYYRTTATAVARSQVGDGLCVTVQRPDGALESLSCRYVFNCTYSWLNQLQGDFPGVQTGLKHEITELALVEPPPELREIGVTVMDGPFFSIMPFPARRLHTLSHVRYTPHLSWKDERGNDPYQKLAEYDRQTRVDRMLRDASRYLPCMLKARYVDSLFEVKTVLVKNEGDDGRPILFEKYAALPGCYSVLGGKIDNIYDVLERLEQELALQRAKAEVT